MGSDTKNRNLESEHNFARVLRAEEIADNRLIAGRAEAGRIQSQATVTERRVGERADKRLGKMHAAMQTCIETEKAKRVAAFEAERAELSTPHMRPVIVAAAQRLARRLAGIMDP